MTEISNTAVTRSIGTALSSLRASQQAVQDAAAAVYTAPVAPPANSTGGPTPAKPAGGAA